LSQFSGNSTRPPPLSPQCLPEPPPYEALFKKLPLFDFPQPHDRSLKTQLPSAGIRKNQSLSLLIFLSPRQIRFLPARRSPSSLRRPPPFRQKTASPDFFLEFFPSFLASSPCQQILPSRSKRWFEKKQPEARSSSLYQHSLLKKPYSAAGPFVQGGRQPPPISLFLSFPPPPPPPLRCFLLVRALFFHDRRQPFFSGDTFFLRDECLMMSFTQKIRPLCFY